MKRALSLILSLTLILALFTGVNFASAADDFSQEVTVQIMLHGSNVTDPAPVIEKINEYLKEKLNMKLDVIWGTWADFDQNSVLMLAGGDPCDIYFTCSWSANEYASYARNGSFLRLDDPENDLIAAYAPDLFKSIPAILGEGALVDGASGEGIYAIPGYKDFAQLYTWDINTPLLTELGYTLEDIKSYADFGPLLAAAKALKGDSFYPLYVEQGVMQRFVLNLDIVDSSLLLGLQFDTENPSQTEPIIKSVYEMPEYKAFVEKTYEYSQAGYINPVHAVAEASNSERSNAQLNGAYLIGTQVYAPGYEAQASAERGFEVSFVPLHTQYTSITSLRGAMMAVSAYSKHPERAVAFLNLLNTDPYLMTLMAYGVEGVHYTINADGLLEFTDKHNDYMPWRNGIGNITLLPPQAAEGADIWDKYAAQAEAQVLPTGTWSFDQTPVANEMAALANVAAEYTGGLTAGTVDPAVVLPEFIEKLKANGIDKVVEEANRQLQEYLANQAD
ncbi:MAG: ABC transporter substrate-binding protein [Oscillospiraceae bacterium]|jgi:putative aldouronate transport system substrate-binding protein|nr:ABC transporter substrate-binding protein [Oscillospiraceae bacterium]